MKHTQKQLEAMSDYELSADILTLYDNYDGSEIGRNEAKSKATFRLGWARYSFDINNWSDMGPLLRKNNITIVYENGEIPCAVVIDDLSDFVVWSFNIQCFNKNELRAAAIVYILIKQGE